MSRITSAALFSLIPVGAVAFQVVSPTNEAPVRSQTELAQGESPSDKHPELRGVMVLRVSERYLRELFARDIDRRTPVHQVVLGTRARGIAHTTGRADVDTKADADRAAFHVRIYGCTNSRTVGRNGPAIIHSRSVTRWTATKTVNFDGENFVASPGTIISLTQLTPLGADSVLPGLRGRIVRRIASRKAIEYNSAAERITGRNAEHRVLADVNRIVDLQVKKLNDRIQNRPLMALLLGKLKDAGVEFSTGHNCINISFGGSSAPEAKILPLEGLDPSDTELWFQTALIGEPESTVPALIDDAAAWLKEKLPGIEVTVPAVDPTGLSALPLDWEVIDDWVVFRSHAIPRLTKRLAVSAQSPE